MIVQARTPSIRSAMRPADQGHHEGPIPVGDRYGHAGIAVEVARLAGTRGGQQRDAVTLHADPQRHAVWLAVRQQGGARCA
jgi:hypothetical protein